MGRRLYRREIAQASLKRLSETRAHHVSHPQVNV